MTVLRVFRYWLWAGVFGAALALTGANADAPPVDSLRQQAQAGDTRAQVMLGRAYYRGENDYPKNYEQAAYWFRQAANAGDIEGMFNLAVALHHGLGVETDLRDALRWYRKAGEGGLPQARLMEALIYRSGIPATATETEIPPDSDRARKLFEELAAQGYPPALRELGIGILQQAGENPSRENYRQAFEYWYDAAEKGDVPSCSLAANLLLRGLGVEKDETRAAALLEAAARAGDGESAAQWAFCLEYGIGAARDEELALEWYRRAASAGVAAAQLKLGELYLAGQWVDAMDVPRALEYFRLAAASGLPAALFRLGVCYSEGTGVKKDALRAADYYLQAANGNYAQAQFNLGWVYLNAAGIPKDEAAAFYWFKQAAENGLMQAQRQLAYCYFSGTGIEKNEMEGLRWLKQAALQGDLEARALLEGDSD